MSIVPPVACFLVDAPVGWSAGHGVCFDRDFCCAEFFSRRQDIGCSNEEWISQKKNVRS